jgi:hypothetical protein
MWLQFLAAFVAKPRAKFVTMQKLDKQLFFKLVRAMRLFRYKQQKSSID